MEAQKHECIGIVALASVLIILSTAAISSSQDVSLAVARREGTVLWYNADALLTAERVSRLFEQAHPEIIVEVHRSGCERILKRILDAQASRQRRLLGHLIGNRAVHRSVAVQSISGAHNQ